MPDNTFDAGPMGLVAVVLIAASLAGCVGSSSSSSSIPWSSFDEAMAAEGEVFAPTDDGSVRLKLLRPADPAAAETGKQDVIVLLFDGETEDPITDAEMTLEARMPAMGHGTSPEEDPTHETGGIYVGMTNIIMAGEWILNLDATLADGTAVAFDVTVTIPGGVGTDDGGSGDQATSFGSFEEAMQASGETFAPAAAWVLDEKTDGDSGVVALPADPVYNKSVPFEIGNADGAEIVAEATLQPGSDADELTFAITDPDGNAADSFTLTADDTSGNLTLSDVGTAGNWSLDVTGRALQASYDVNVTVRYPADPVTLKTLVPSDPAQAGQDKQPFTVLLYTTSDESPVTDATVSLSSYMTSMGHGTTGEVDPSHQGDGVYEGETNLVMPGKWEITVVADRPDGSHYEWRIPAEVPG